jgi:hypothetical protein
MGALATRACLPAGGDDDLCPVSERHRPPAVLADDLAPVWTGAHALTAIDRRRQAGTPERIAAGVARLAPVTAEVAGQPDSWLERRWVIRACPRAPAGERGLPARMATAPAAVRARNPRGRGPRRCPDPRALRPAVATSRSRDRGQGVLHGRSTERWWVRPRRRYARRAATERPEWAVEVTVRLTQEAVAAAVRHLGWRVYVPTQPPAQRSLQEAVLAYRRASLGARAMGRLKGRPWSLTPLDLARDDHATGLLRLWSSGWRVLTWVAFEVRRRVAMAKTALAGVSVGHPKRATPRPPAERRLEAVRGLTRTIIRAGRRRRDQLTPLSRVPRRRRARLNLPGDLYLRRYAQSHQPP